MNSIAVQEIRVKHWFGQLTLYKTRSVVVYKKRKLFQPMLYEYKFGSLKMTLKCTKLKYNVVRIDTF